MWTVEVMCVFFESFYLTLVMTTRSLVSIIIFVLGSKGCSLDALSARSADLYGLAPSVVVDLDDVFDGFPIGEAAKAVGLNVGLVNENVLAAIIGKNEAIALDRIEPRRGKNEKVNKRVYPVPTTQSPHSPLDRSCLTSIGTFLRHSQSCDNERHTMPRRSKCGYCGGHDKKEGSEELHRWIVVDGWMVAEVANLLPD